MFTNRAVWFAIVLAFVGSSSRAQNVPISGLYQIISGSYSECCGIAGDLGYALPAQPQTFVSLQIDPQTGFARMTFLGQDEQTVFSVTPCPPINPIHFRFDYGFVSSNQIFFHVDPGPDQKFW